MRHPTRCTHDRRERAHIQAVPQILAHTTTTAKRYFLGRFGGGKRIGLATWWHVPGPAVRGSALLSIGGSILESVKVWEGSHWRHMLDRLAKAGEAAADQQASTQGAQSSVFR